MIEFPLIFGETYFVEVPKIHGIYKIVALEKKVPYGKEIPAHPIKCYAQQLF